MKIIKIFGFRTGAAYKMIPAILYYAFMAFYIVTGIYGELKYYSLKQWIMSLWYLNIYSLLYCSLVR
ncbi:MAG: hypothetical protein ACLT2Z_06260 [Eubacterium sp.]